MTAIRKIFSSFRIGNLHSSGFENGKNESEILNTGKNLREITENKLKYNDKVENFIFLFPPVILLLAIIIMYILFKNFY